MAGDKHALIIDDDNVMRRLLEGVLQQIGFTHIQSAADGRIALEIIGGNGKKFDLVICDWMMPKMDGLEFLKEFRVTYPDTPFIMLTAKSETKDFHAAKAMGATHFFMQPLEAADLAVRIKATLDLASS